MASLIRPTYTDRKTGRQKKAKKWYGQYRDDSGVVRRVPLSTNKDAARVMLADLTKKLELKKVGVVDPFEEHRTTLLSNHLEAYRKTLLERDLSKLYIETAFTRLKTVFDGCAFARLADLSAESAQAWIAHARKKPRGIGPQTANHYTAALKAFGSWCYRTRRLGSNPFQFMTKVNVSVDIRHRRRSLPQAEFDALVAAAQVGETFRGVTGPDRAMLYLTAAFTGLRASELASLTLSGFDLTSTPPTVTVEAGYSKRRRRDVIPIHPELATLLRSWLANRSEGRIWAGLWAENKSASDLMKRDLSRARTKWINEAMNAEDRSHREQSDFLMYKDRAGTVADFHSLRHTFITRLVEAGVRPKEAKELARHSTITLTMDRYAHVTIADTAVAVGKLAGPACPNACTKLALSMDISGRLTTVQDGEAAKDGNVQTCENTVENKENPELPPARFERATPSLGNCSSVTQKPGLSEEIDTTAKKLAPQLAPLLVVVEAWPLLSEKTRELILQTISNETRVGLKDQPNKS